jgi:membrane-bound lytic murein transglycosylase B
VKPIKTTITALLLLACALQAGAVTKKPKPIRKVSASRATQATGPLYATRADVMQQADEIAQRRNLDADWVRQAIGQAHYMAGIARAILPPPVGVPKNWALYRSRFVEPLRIKAGTKFWLANQATLQRAEELTGVPASIIVGIVGVETIYGQNTGNYRVIDALSTLAFDFPASHPKAEARAAFFKSELEEYLALTARTHTDPLALRGSYAGAMGWPQFMPSSWSRYAIDFDGDGRVDLFNSQADVIGSVANYFQAFHWQRGMPTHYPVHFDAATLDLPALLAPDIRPTFSVAEMAARGALLDDAGNQHSGPLALIELQNGDAPAQYVAGTENFYAITRYNWSSYYAMAVIELGQAVAQTVAAQGLTRPQEPAQTEASMPK